MKVICVSAVKGGVGKTMISLNIARLLKARNYKVGLLDADFDNANFAQFTQIDGKVGADPVEGFTLYDWDGVSVFSMSLIAGREKAVSMPAEQYWQFVSDIAHKSSWNVDYLIVDLPGGGGDVFKAWKLGFKIVEVPIIFTDRKEGTSKMSGGIFGEAMWGVLKMKINSWLHPIKPFFNETGPTTL